LTDQLKTQQIQVPEDFEPLRLDAFLGHQDLGISRSQIQKMIANGQVRVNGELLRSKDLLQPGDSIEISGDAPRNPAAHLNPRPFPLEILFEDSDLIVVNKPAGLVSHPGIGTYEVTLLEAVFHHIGLKSESDARQFGGQWDSETVDHPGIVHRLDKDTSGVMVLAKNPAAHEGLARQFREKTNLREYLALLDGCTNDRSWEVENYLMRDPTDRLRYTSLTLEEYEKRLKVQRSLESMARYAKTMFDVKATYADRLMLVSARLLTGRTHQIRIHARDMRIPVVGDPLYGRRLLLGTKFTPEIRQVLEGIKRQMLHALTLGFKHPSSGQDMAFQGKLPSDFDGLLRILRDFRST
jgi:23S rRNA pseudouridine1911/1915/1917 synthase